MLLIHYNTSDAQGIVISDTLPAGMRYVSGSVTSPSGSCTANGQKVTCTMGQIFANDSYNANIEVKAPSTEGVITNTASVTADQLDTNTSNDKSAVTTTVSKDASTAPADSSGGAPAGSSSGGSLPLELLLLALPFFLRKKLSI